MEGTPAGQLDPDDARILALESAAIAGHTMKLAVLEAAEQPLDLERLRAAIAERLPAQARARERVETGAAGPRWVVDQDFEIDRHVRRCDGADGGDDADLWRLAGQLMGERLDHERPLWRIDLAGPLADGREALVVRIHHAMADGVSCMRFLDAVLWDHDPRIDEPVRPRPGGHGGAPGESTAQELRRLPAALRRELGGHAGRSPLDRAIGASREVALAAVPLDALREVGHARPARATVNDVLLAAVAGALRAWLGAGGVLPPMRAQVPVSLHHRDSDPGELGNRDAFLNVDLPLAEPDPLVRLDRISAQTRERKRLGDADELYDFFHALRRLHHLGPLIERLAGGPREFSLSISNVPGPPRPVSVAGRRVERLGTFAEPAMRHALRISAISCAGAVAVSACTDPEALPDVGGFAEALVQSFAELGAAAIE